MKQAIYFFCACIIFLSACTKTDIKSATNTFPASEEERLSAVKIRSALLVAHPWIYQGYYFHYVDPNNKGDVQYERGGTNNVIDLDETRFTFKPDHTFIEIDGGYTYLGTWHFADNTATVLYMYFTYGTDVETIIALNNNHFNYTQPLGYGDKSYTELIPAQ